MEADERYERLEKCIEALGEANAATPILVEGVRDERALRMLGCAGTIQVYNAGLPIDRVAHRIAREHRRVIVLLDWDRTGGHLVRRLLELLQAEVELDLEFRKEFAIVSQVRSVEDLPAALALWKQRAAAMRDQTGASAA